MKAFLLWTIYACGVLAHNVATPTSKLSRIRPELIRNFDGVERRDIKSRQDHEHTRLRIKWLSTELKRRGISSIGARPSDGIEFTYKHNITERYGSKGQFQRTVEKESLGYKFSADSDTSIWASAQSYFQEYSHLLPPDHEWHTMMLQKRGGIRGEIIRTSASNTSLIMWTGGINNRTTPWKCTGDGVFVENMWYWEWYESKGLVINSLNLVGRQLDWPEIMQTTPSSRSKKYDPCDDNHIFYWEPKGRGKGMPTLYGSGCLDMQLDFRQEAVSCFRLIKWHRDNTDLLSAELK